MAANEKVTTHSRSVSCDGGTGALGHPEVFFTIASNETQVVCPYCSKTFVYKAK